MITVLILALICATATAFRPALSRSSSLRHLSQPLRMSDSELVRDLMEHIGMGDILEEGAD